MNKTKIATALLAIFLAGCSSDDYTGADPVNGSLAINFGTMTGGATRADKTGSDAAADLGNSFVVYAMKLSGGNSNIAFDHYNVEYAEGSANSTESNNRGWEYVGVTPVNSTSPLTTKVEGEDYTTAATDDDFVPVTKQTIKYWDKNYDEYDFYAFSRGRGAGSPATYATFSTVNYHNVTDCAYTITGTCNELSAAYVADKLVVTKSGYTCERPVTPKFRNVAAKVRIGIYETVPGYSVKDVKFYQTSSATETTANACLFAGTDQFVSSTAKGVLTVYFGEGTKAMTRFVPETSATKTPTLDFAKSLSYVGPESHEPTGNSYVARSSSFASYVTPDKADAYITVFPTGTGTPLTLKVDYTLVPTDGGTAGAGEIHMKGVTAVVPDTYSDWQSNYAYTYIFKISDDPSTGLYPISFDAAEIVDGAPQETDTENSGPSITTYQNGINVTENNEYLPGKPIYTIVGNYNTMSITAADYWKEGYIHLFKATVEDGAVQGIDELSVSNCFTYGTYDATAKTYTVTDINGKKLVLTDVSSLLTVPGEIPATDGPNGTAVTKADAIAKIANPEANTVYVFQYLDYPAEYAEVPFNTLKKGAPMYCVNMGEDWMRFILKGYADGTEPIHDALYYNPETTPLYNIIKEYSFDATPFGDDLVAGTSYYKVEEETYNLDGVDCPAFKYSIVTAASGDVNNGNYYEYDGKQVMSHLTFLSYTDGDFITLATGQDCYMIDSDTRRYTRVVAKGIETSTGKAVTTQPRHVYKVIRTGSAPVAP